MDNEKDTSVSEDISNDIAALLQDLPEEIRNFVSGPEPEQVISRLVEKYALSPDQKNIVRRDLLLMLLGVIEPGDLHDSLTEAGVPEKTAGAIVAAIGEDVFSRFFPIQKKETPESNEVQAGKPLNEPEVLDTPSSETPPAPNTTPLVKEYVADPYREPVE